MKSAFKLLFVACCVVSSASVLTGCATGVALPQQGQVAEGPARWQILNGFEPYGLTMTGNPSASLTGPAEVVFTATKEVDLLATAADSTNPNLLRTFSAKRDGDQLRVGLNFPASGTYQVSLMARTAADKSDRYTVLAVAMFKVAIDPSATVTMYPGAARYGLAFAGTPQSQVGDEATVTLTFQKDFTLVYGFTNRTTGKSVADSVDFSHGSTQIVAVIDFPETGDYELSIGGRPKGATSGYEDFTTVRFHATVDPSRLPQVPAGWTPGPGYKRFGVTVTSLPPAQIMDLARVEFTTDKEISLAYSIRNNAKENEKLSEMVSTGSKGTANSAEVFFPESGEYTLWLFGKTKEDKDYLQIARIPFSVKQPDRTGVLPSNWTVHPRFWAFNVGVISAPPTRDVNDTLGMVLKLPAECSVTAALKNKATGNYVRTITSSRVGAELRITALFPTSGEYELSFSAKKETDEYTWTIGKAAFVATVDDSSPRYRLWLTKGAWPEIPFTKVEEVNTAWKPQGQWSEEEAHQKAVLGTDFAVPVGENMLSLRKGTTVEFSMAKGQLVPDRLAFTLPREVTHTVEEVPVTFKAGSPFVVSSDGVAGVLAKDARIPIHGTELLLPKGSRLVVDYTLLSEIELNGKGTLTFNKTRYECTGLVIVQTSCFGDTPSTVSVVLSRAAPLSFGPTRFTLPAGAMIAFSKDGIDHVVPAVDLELVINGQKDTIPAGWSARFDAQGVMEKHQAE